MTKSKKPKEPTGYIWAVKSSIKRAPKWLPDEVVVITDGETKGKLLIYCGWTLTIGGANKAWPISRLRTSHRAADNATGALSQLEAVKKLNPLSDVQVFLAGKIVTIEQLNARAREESGRAMYGDEWCNACDARARAGFEGQCPACANERARSGGVGC